MKTRDVIKRKAEDIVAGCLATHSNTNSTDQVLCIACSMATALALLTSTSQAERDQGKTMVRDWKQAGVSHAKQDAID